MSASNESKLLTRVLFNSGELRDLEKHAFNPNLLPPDYAQAFQEVARFYTEHGEIPKAKDLLSKVPTVEILKEEPSQKATVYWEAIFYDRFRIALVSAIQQAARMFPEQIDPNVRALKLSEITSATIDLFSEVAAKFMGDSGRPKLIGELMDELEKEYNSKEKQYAKSIPIPFEFLQEEMRGWKPGDLYVVAGRPKSGKTWFALISAVEAVKHGDKVLMVSLEMKQTEMARRFACILSRISYNRTCKKTLTPPEKAKYLATLRALKTGDLSRQILLVGPGTVKTPEAIGSMAANFGADFVIVDSFYTMESKGEEYWQQVQSLVRKYRRISAEPTRAWMLVTQLNRSAKGRKTTSVDTLGMSDAIGQDANAIIYLVRGKNLRKARQVDIILGEAREAEDVQAFRHNWNFVDMKWNAVGAVDFSRDDSDQEA